MMGAALAAPNGYTMVMVAPNVAISPSLYRRLGHDPIRDFAPIAPTANVTMVIVTHPGLPAQTLKDFVVLAKAKPGHRNYGSGGSGTSLHLAGELFKITAGVDLVHVPYKGASVAMNDVLGGQLDSLFIGIPAPAGTPKEVVARLNREIVKIMTTAETKERFANAVVTVHMEPETPNSSSTD